MSSEQTIHPASITPLVSLELRVRWLEALVMGVKPTPDTGKAKAKVEELSQISLVRRTEDVQKKLDEALEENDGLRRFVNSYDEYANLLALSSATNPTSNPEGPSTYETLSPSELETLLADLEPELRSADRDLREIDTLEKRGVTAAGRLPDHEPLKPRLQALVEAHAEDMKRYASIEKRMSSLLERYSSQVNALSELFVSWNDSVMDAEDAIVKLSRDRDARQKLEF